MSDPSIQTVFLVVPESAAVVGPTLSLNAIVLVEWKMNQGQIIPAWMNNWSGRSANIAVTLEDDQGIIAHVDVPVTNGETPIDLAVARAGEHARNAIAGNPRVVPIGSSLDLWTSANATNAALGSAPSPTPGVAALAYIDSSKSPIPTASNPTPAVTTDFITSRIATRYPQLATSIGLRWNVRFDLNDWQKLLNRPLWFQCLTDFAESTVVAPYTECVIRTVGKQVFCWPNLKGSAQVLAQPGIEGLIRMLPTSGDQPKWFLESAEHMAAALQQTTANASGDRRMTRALSETGGLAIACQGIEKILQKSSTSDVRKNQPILSWVELVSGYRVEVWTSSAGWRSVVGRTVAGENVTHEDEGYIEIGSIVLSNQAEQWQFEEIARWGGGSILGASEEVVAGRRMVVTGRPDVAARLRWNQTYSLGMRPVFKGNVGPTLEDASAIRQALTEHLYAAEPHVFLREERLGAPELFGPTADNNIHLVLCSTEGSEIPESSTLAIWPPRVSASLIKRSGVLDEHETPKDQAAYLRRAARTYPNPDESRFPDPYAREIEIAISLRGTPCTSCDTLSESETLVPGITKKVIAQWNISDEWVDVKPVNVSIVAGKTNTVHQKGNHLRIELARGKHVTIAMHCAFEQAPEKFAHARRILNFFSTRRQHPTQFSIPPSLICDELVVDARHVTRQPLQTPEMTDPIVQRQFGQPEAIIRDLIRADRMTTRDMVATARWKEWAPGKTGMEQVDKGLETPPVTVSSERAEDFGTAGELTAFIPAEFRLPFPDARRKDIQVNLAARSRDGERFRKGGITSVGQSRSVIVPNAKRPTAPRVSIVLPLIGLDEVQPSTSTQPRTWRQTTIGDRLRIYLGNRWYETGNGELLGVVCAPESQGSISDESRRGLKAYVTQWGAEVLVATPPISPGPFARNFVAKSLVFDGMLSTTGQANDQPVVAVVAGHEVQFDENADEYFTDVAIEAHGSPYAWIRLALARLQPESVLGAHLSPTVIAQYSQLLPNRCVTVSEAIDNGNVLNIAASRTPVNETQTSSTLTALVSLWRPAKIGEVAAHDGLQVYGNHVWEQVSEVLMQSHVGAALSQYWLAELQAPSSGEFLVAIQEYWHGPGLGPRPQFLRWETRVFVQR
jgi:hypothetical protein